MKLFVLFLILFSTLFGKEGTLKVIQHKEFYTLSLDNNPFDPSEKLDLFQMRMNENISILFPLKIVNGILMAERNQRLEPLTSIKFSNQTMPGETLSYAILSSNKTNHALVRITPNPIEATLPSGQKVWLELNSSQRYEYALYGTGFKPYEKLSIQIRTNTEFYETKKTLNSIGDFDEYISHRNTDHPTGIAEIIITTEDGQSLPLKYDWGQRLSN